MISPSYTVLVTGAGGFVGRSLVPWLRKHGITVRPVGRADVGEIGPETDWQSMLNGVQAVVHLAGRAHIMREGTTASLPLYRRINTQGTLRLAGQAAACRVRRFIFMSSIKVMGEQSDQALTAQQICHPSDPYGLSKWEAEQGLAALSGQMDCVILRPPLVYGPGVKGNFLTLLKLVEWGVPLPLVTVHNKRSLIGRINLVDAVRMALACPLGIYLPSDGKDVSTPDLLQQIAAALNRPARLFPSLYCGWQGDC